MKSLNLNSKTTEVIEKKRSKMKKMWSNVYWNLSICEVAIYFKKNNTKKKTFLWMDRQTDGQPKIIVRNLTKFEKKNSNKKFNKFVWEIQHFLRNSKVWGHIKPKRKDKRKKWD